MENQLQHDIYRCDCMPNISDKLPSYEIYKIVPYGVS